MRFLNFRFARALTKDPSAGPTFSPREELRLTR